MGSPAPSVPGVYTLVGPGFKFSVHLPQPPPWRFQFVLIRTLCLFTACKISCLAPFTDSYLYGSLFWSVGAGPPRGCDLPHGVTEGALFLPDRFEPIHVSYPGQRRR